MTKQLPTSLIYQFLIEPGIWPRLSNFETELGKFFKQQGVDGIVIQEVAENKWGIVWLKPTTIPPQVKQPDKAKIVKF